LQPKTAKGVLIGMNKKMKLQGYYIEEEIVNAILHGLGTLAAITGLVFMCLKSIGFMGGERSGGIVIVSVVIFSATMTGMYLMSTLYHSIQPEKAKKFFQKMDHAMIFVFIAGTYTPYCLIVLGGGWGWSIFCLEWFMAVVGITLTLMDLKILKKIEVAVYIAMGWVIVIGSVPLIRSIPVQSLIFLMVGGIFYTFGTIWYRRKGVKYAHAVWHTFVILGTVFHWFSVWYLI
jgi:hemolysin III